MLTQISGWWFFQQQNKPNLPAAPILDTGRSGMQSSFDEYRPTVSSTLRQVVRAAATVLALLTWTLLGVRQVSAQFNVTTWHNDNALTGRNTSETTLKPANVNPAN